MMWKRYRTCCEEHNLNINTFFFWVHLHQLECAVNLGWLIEHAEWSVADAEWPQPPSDSLLWPDLSIASILSASVTGVLMWAGGPKVTKLIMPDDEALPASLVSLHYCVWISSRTTWQISFFKTLCNFSMFAYWTFHAVSGEYKFRLIHMISVFSVSNNEPSFKQIRVESFPYSLKLLAGRL